MKRTLMLAALVFLPTLLLPWLAVHALPDDTDMAAILALFFVVDPLMAALVGALGRRWYWPIVYAASFMAGCWTVLDFGNGDFAVYAGAYLVMGWIALAVRSRLKRE